jgi:hypothetical protein
LGAEGIEAARSTATLAHSVLQQAFMQATDDFAWLSGCIFTLLVFLVWAVRRPGAPKAGAVTADAGH